MKIMRIKEQNSIISIIFTVYMVIAPALSMYSSGILTITITDIGLFFIVIICSIDLVKRRMNKVSISFSMLLFFLLIILQLLALNFVKSGQYFGIILMPTLRFAFYILVLCLFSKEYFDFELGYKTLKIVSILATVLLLLQFFVFRVSGFYIPGRIPFFEVLNADITKFEASISANSVVRPRSFFAEPAHYSQYVLLFLALSLIKKKKSKKEYIGDLFVSVGIIASVSSTGIIMLAVLWLIWILKQTIRLKSVLRILFICIIMLAIPLVLTFFLQFDAGKLFVERTFNDGSMMGRATVGRLGGYEKVYNIEGKDIGEILFGNGMDTSLDENYLAGIPRMYVYFGVMGMVFLSGLFIYMLRKGTFAQKMVIIFMINKRVK